MHIMQNPTRILVVSIAAAVSACGTTQAVEKGSPPSTQTAAPTPRPDSVQALVADAGKLLRDGRASEAKAKYAQALAKEPESFDARVGAAACDLQLGDHETAKVALAALQKERPEAREITILLGLLLKEKGDYRGGIQIYKDAIDKAEKKGEQPDPDLLNNLIVLYRLNKDYEEGERTCRRLLARDPKNVDALKNLSLIYFDQEKFALAETVAVDSLKLNDKDASLYNNRGMIRVKRGRFPEAVSFFKRAVEIDPANLAAHLNLGSIALRYRDYATAATHFGEAMKLEPRHAEANLGFGFALAGQQKPDEAIQQLQRALDINPGAAEAYGEIAMVTKLQLNKAQDALGWCEKYKGARGGKLDDKDPMKGECAAIETELKSAAAARAAMERMKAEEDAEKAKQPPPPSAVPPKPPATQVSQTAQ